MRQMQWFNEPEHWEQQGDQLVMAVTAKTDYWRRTHYGFIVDDGPFYYCEVGGEFEAAVQITGQYQTRFDQMGLMLRIDEENWIKTGIEFVDGSQNLSAVVTREFSDWNVVALDHSPESVWLKVLRKLDAVEISYSFDNVNYQLLRLAYLPANKPVKVGLMAASPDGEGFEAKFNDFKVKQLPDTTRTHWLNKNQ